MSVMIKTFWISFLCISILGVVILGIVGIPPKPVAVVKTIPNDQFPQ
jgi:hypothetical protein